MTELLERCTEIGSLAKPGRIKYSICTLVNDREEYESMVASFVAGGFSFDDCEYIYADNCSYNKYDAYRAYNTFLAAAAGEYIILCHQDVTLIHDGRAELCRVIEEMDRLDPDWAILGNAGVKEDGGVALRISDPYGEDTCRGQLPARVESVDENFIVVRRTANLAVSHDLFGFHFYGADLCIMASILGYRAYVVDFHLCHKGRGTYDATFFQLREAVCRKYHAAFRTRRVRTMCATLLLTGNRTLAGALVSYLRLRQVIRRIREKHATVGVTGLLNAVVRRIFSMLAGSVLYSPRYTAAWREVGRPQRFERSDDLVSHVQSLSDNFFGLAQLDSEIVPLLDRVRALSPRTVLEIGSHLGGTLFLWTRVAADDALLVSVDLPGGPFGGGYGILRAPLLRRLALPGQHVELVRADSHKESTLREVTRILSGAVDLLFIDGDHTYEGVKQDFGMYAPLVRSGGMVVFHDIALKQPDPTSNVRAFWDEIKAGFRFTEIIDDHDQLGFGLGVLEV